jgi:signal transduction histidine kinase
LAKVEAGKHQLELMDIDIGFLLENSLVMIKEKALKHGIDLSLRINGVPETIRADERKLKQILYNLLSNAVKSTPDGGKILLAAGACDAETEYHFALGGNPLEYIQISVSDSGIGLNPDDLERVFQPFEQTARAGYRQGQSTGLGLSLTRQLVELHGGKIWAKSDGLQKGATFCFFLPKTSSAVANQQFTGSVEGGSRKDGARFGRGAHSGVAGKQPGDGQGEGLEAPAKADGRFKPGCRS